MSQSTVQLVRYEKKINCVKRSDRCRVLLHYAFIGIGGYCIYAIGCKSVFDSFLHRKQHEKKQRDRDFGRMRDSFSFVSRRAD